MTARKDRTARTGCHVACQKVRERDKLNKNKYTCLSTFHATTGPLRGGTGYRAACTVLAEEGGRF